MILKREKEGEISCSCALRIVPLIRKNTVLSGEFITVIPLQMKPSHGNPDEDPQRLPRVPSGVSYTGTNQNKILEL